MKLAVIIVAIVAIAACAGMWWLAGFAMKGSRMTLDEAFAWQSDHYDTSFYEPLEKTDYTVAATEGYLLHVQLLTNPTPCDRYVIMSHGNADNRMGSLKYVPLYLELGFNCIIYDLRGHGLNEPTCTTYGLLEGADLACLVRDTRERYPDLTQLGLHGESLGGATTICALGHAPEVDFAVSDCAFADIDSVLRKGYRDAGAPVFLVDVADVAAKLRFHYSLKDMRPIDALADNHVPVLFIHGLADELIVVQNARDLYAATAGPRELLLVEGAGHAQSIFTDPEAYKEHVAAFVQMVDAHEG